MHVNEGENTVSIGTGTQRLSAFHNIAMDRAFTKHLSGVSSA